MGKVFVFTLLENNKVMKMQETNSTAYGAEAASKVHRELKKIGGVKPPESLFLWIELLLAWDLFFFILVLSLIGIKSLMS